MNRLRAAELAAALVLTLACGAAAALQSDREQPMDIASDASEGQLGAGITTLTGNVRITQGTLDVRADRAEVYSTKERQITRVVLTGAPATLKQDLDEGGRIDASAERFEHDVAADKLVMTGNVVLVQPRGEIRAPKVTYDLKAGSFESGGEGSGRVRMRIAPQPKAAEATKPASPPNAG